MAAMDVEHFRDAPDHEHVVIGRDSAAGYVGIVAIHSTRLGPAVGGTRLLEYRALRDAIDDALRLSRGMTYKNALAGLPFGGGKAVILGPPPAEPADRATLFRAHGRVIDTLDGRFITGEDVGTSPSDMEVIASETVHVAGRTEGMGDPSPYTARGIVYAMEAAARATWGSAELEGRSVAIQGLGNVGSHLARLLHERGARLVVTDIDPGRVAEVVDRYDATPVAAEEIVGAEVDVFAPCALGGVIDEVSVERLRARVVCGGANNQLRTPDQGRRLMERGIRYVPDYVANAGGVISGSVDIAGWDRARMEKALAAIFDTVLEVFAKAEVSGVTTDRAADAMAEERLRD